MNRGIYTKFLTYSALLLLSGTRLGAQAYKIGDQLSQSTLDAEISYCTNATGMTTLGEVLNPEGLTPPRAVWLNFFASW